MSTLSPFQSLPSLISEAITCWCCSDRQSTNNRDFSDSERARKMWAELYNVSHSWRVLSQGFFFEDATFNISAKSGTGQLAFYRLPESIKVDVPTYRYIKRVSIVFTDLPKPLDEADMHDFSLVWPEDLVLPSVRRLSVSLAGFLYQINKYGGGSSSSMDDRFSWLSQRIQSSMPKLCSVTLDDNGLDILLGDASTMHIWEMDTLFSAIFERAAEVSFTMNYVFPIYDHSLIQSEPRLTSLNCTLARNSILLQNMVGKSAAMLESLIIRNYDMQDLRSFFFDETDRAIIYPRLRKLGFYNDDRFRGEEKFRVNKEISVFPVLRSLKWQSEYIFDDDTLFRGNSDTLKKLDIELGKDLVQVLQRYSVFSNGRYSQLCHVSTQDAGINSTMRISANEHVRLGVSLIVPETKFFSFSGYRLSDLEIISESPYLENIQVLRLTEAEVSLKSLFGLVKLLPNVTKLAFSPVIMDMIPTGDQFERVVFNLYNQYYPLSHHLRHWEYLGEFTEGGGISVLYNLLAIVTVCPSFVSAFIPSNYKKGLERSVKGTAKRGLYNKHIIGKVQRIVRNMS